MNSAAEISFIPKLTPTITEFTNLLKYIYDNEALISSYGGCKIIPPREWAKVKTLSLSSIDHAPPISRQSIIKLSPLVFRVTNTQRKSLNERRGIQFKAFVEYAQRPQNRIPFEVIDIESNMWAMLNSDDIAKRTIRSAINIDYSLFAQSETIFNLTDISSKSLLSLTTQRIKGITSPFLHVGMYGSIFALHTEEHDLFSMNYMHEGSSKFWYIVPPSHADQLEQCLRDIDTLDTSHCQAPLQHKTLFPNPFELAQLHNIPVYRIEQCPNEIIVILPRAYNWGFDGGFNVTESINFGLPSWVPFGRSARSCLCQRVGNSVELYMEPFTKENVLTYTQTHLSSQLLQLQRILMTSDQQPILDLEPMESNIEAATFTYLSSDEASALIDEDFSIYFSESLPQTTSGAAYIADNEQPLPSLSAPQITTPTEELPFDHCASLEINSMALEQDEIAAETARIRRKWIEEKDTLMARLVADVTKPEIGSICQWETLVNSDNVVLDDYLPENIPNCFQHNRKVIESFADWTVAFMSFRKAVLYIFKHRGPELDAHFEHISKVYRDSYSIKLILAYEKDIRHHVNKMPDQSLFSDFPSLWNKHFVDIQPTNTVNKTQEQKQICRKYNSHFKRCRTLKKCSRLHICSICFNSMNVQMKHSAAFCPTRRSNGRQKHP